MQYMFTAVFTKDGDDTVFVSFPDLPGCCAQGTDMLDAATKAKAVLSLCLFDMERQGIETPEMRLPPEMDLNPGEVASMVVADTDAYHACFNDRADYMLAVPSWLGYVAEKSSLNLSRMLQDAVRREIGLPVYEAEDMPVSAVELAVESMPADEPVAIMTENAAEDEDITDEVGAPPESVEVEGEPEVQEPQTSPETGPAVEAVSGAAQTKSRSKKATSIVLIVLIPVLVLAAILLVVMIFTNWLDAVPVFSHFMYVLEARMDISFDNAALRWGQ